jgi:membrane-anchored mycosin MYCP
VGAGVSRIRAVVVVAMVLAAAVIGPVPAFAAPGVRAAAAPAPACAKPTGVYDRDTPWPQLLFEPTRIWPLSTGEGVTVAVLGTGVDAGNPQFARGQVVDGHGVSGDTAAVGSGPATVDCDGRGTFAAGIIAAHAHRVTTVAGLAPGVRVLAIRYTQSTTQGSAVTDPDLLAEAIRAAIAGHAGVICVVVPSEKDSGSLRAAVAAAVAADIVVVSPSTPGSNGGRSFPTANPAVLAVGAIRADGTAAAGSAADHIDVAAPGVGLVSVAAGGKGKVGHIWPVDDPAFAAAYVAGTVALVRSYRPGLHAAQVVARVERTADRGPHDGRDPLLGWGVVDPYAAVTAQGIDAPMADAGLVPPPYVPPVLPIPSRPDRLAIALSLTGLALGALLIVGTRVVRRGRERRWRVGVRA